MIKTIITLSLLLLSTLVYAAYPTDYFGVPEVTTSGFFLNAQLGGGFIETNDGTLVDTSTGSSLRVSAKNEDSIAGRLSAGYDFTDYLGIELGAAAWDESDFKWTEMPAGTRGKGDASHYAFDLLGKFNVHLWRGIHVFLKGGVAYVLRQYDLSNSSAIVSMPLRRRVGKDGDQRENSFRPEVALGIGYRITQHWDISLNYVRIFGTGSNSLDSDYVPDLEMATIGVQWNI